MFVCGLKASAEFVTPPPVVVPPVTSISPVGIQMAACPVRPTLMGGAAENVPLGLKNSALDNTVPSGAVPPAIKMRPSDSKTEVAPVRAWLICPAGCQSPMATLGNGTVQDNGDYEQANEHESEVFAERAHWNPFKLAAKLAGQTNSIDLRLLQTMKRHGC